MPNHTGSAEKMRPWPLAIGLLAGVGVAIFFFQERLTQTPPQLATSMLWTTSAGPHDADIPHELAQKVLHRQQEYISDKLSIDLADMRQNITRSILDAMHSGPALAVATPTTPSFLDAMARFPWAETVAALDGDDQIKSVFYYQQLLDVLIPFLVLPPREEAIVECQPPAFTAYTSPIDCSQHPTAFLREPRQAPAKVAHLLQLGFDADILHIQLNELAWAVDKIFIMESTRTHNKNLRKPLLWDRLKSQPRFRPFLDKTIHIVLDDVDALLAEQGTIWGREIIQERARWEAFLAWNNRTGNSFQPDDLIGFGDADEIPAGRNIHLLKQCKLAGPSVDIGSWFAWGRLDHAFRPDWPVPGNPWTLGDPTYWTLQSALEYDRSDPDRSVNRRGFPNRMRGKSAHYLLGGIHMTSNKYPPYSLAKIISCSECAGASAETIRELHDCFVGHACEGLNGEELVKRLMQMMDYSTPHMARMKPIDRAMQDLGEAYYVPWLVQCHPEMFPSWWGKADPRLL